MKAEAGLADTQDAIQDRSEFFAWGRRERQQRWPDDSASPAAMNHRCLDSLRLPKAPCRIAIRKPSSMETRGRAGISGLDCPEALQDQFGQGAAIGRG